MSTLEKRFSLTALAALTSLASLGAAANGSREPLGDDWWQWALSIPGPVNPLTDETGQHCMVGQNRDTWFLGGNFNGGAASRSCRVPQGVKLFFPVANSVSFDAPGVCGQAGSLSVAELRGFSADFINGLTQVSATLDGRPLRTVRRLRSDVFPLALPADNLFAPFCGSTPVPAGIYPRAVDDGYYGEIEHLGVGQHTLQLVASGAGGFSINVVYTLTVVPRDRP
jgi:hypothetical protein